MSCFNPHSRSGRFCHFWGSEMTLECLFGVVRRLFQGNTLYVPKFYVSGRVRPRQGTEICNFGVPSPLEALHWIFCFFSSFYVQFSKTSPLKPGESSEKSSGENRVKSCHVCGCHGFFRPWMCFFWSIKKRVTLLVGIEMSVFCYRDYFDLLFGIEIFFDLQFTGCRGPK